MQRHGGGRTNGCRKPTLFSAGVLTRPACALCQVYTQKLKAVLSEQRAAAADKKTDGGAADWLARRRHADAELRLRRLGQNAQADARRDKLGGHKCIRELKLVNFHTSRKSSKIC